MKNKKIYIIGATICLLLTISVIILIIGNKKSIIGKWKSTDTNNEYYYIFNKDKTCSYEMTVARLDCTYEIEESKLIIKFKGNDKPKSYEYRFENQNLIIKDDTNRDNRFIKEK